MSIKLYNDTCVLRTQTIIGDWSNGMIGVSKTFGGSSILSSPAHEKTGMLVKSGVPVFFVLGQKCQGNQKGNQTYFFHTPYSRILRSLSALWNL